MDNRLVDIKSTSPACSLPTSLFFSHTHSLFLRLGTCLSTEESQLKPNKTIIITHRKETHKLLLPAGTAQGHRVLTLLVLPSAGSCNLRVPRCGDVSLPPQHTNCPWAWQGKLSFSTLAATVGGHVGVCSHLHGTGCCGVYKLFHMACGRREPC